MRRFITAVAIVGLLALLLWVKVAAAKDEQRRKLVDQRLRDRQMFEQGFWAGTRAVTKVLEKKPDGTWALELTNLLHELDHIPQPPASY